jgi:hypothetical protein
MLGVVGNGFKGVGDTVVILGGVTEELTAGTGKVVEDAIRQMNPVDFLQGIMDVSIAPGGVDSGAVAEASTQRTFSETPSVSHAAPPLGDASNEETTDSPPVKAIQAINRLIILPIQRWLIG